MRKNIHTKFTKEKTQMDNERIKRCSISQAIRNISTEITMKHP